jgi:septal ring-binding cell division protein DamX
VEPAAGDLLGARTVATAEWLKQQPDSVYTIQLMGSADEHLLKQHLNVLSKSIEMQKIFVYRVDAHGRPWMNVLYGSFENQPEAEQALKALPRALRAYRPVLRTVQGVRAEVGRRRGA